MSMKLVKAVVAKARADSDLSSAVTQSGVIKFGVFFDEADNDAEMPYIVFRIISNPKIKDFCSDVNNALVQFDLFTQKRNLAEMSDLEIKLNNVFDRATLSYDSGTHIGCALVDEIGPTREDDCWHKINEYQIYYK